MVEKIPTQERSGHIVKITKPEGEYIIIYGRHDQQTKPSDVPDDSTGLMPETGRHLWVDKPEEVFTTLYDTKQYFELFKLAEQKRLPIYFTDTDLEPNLLDDVRFVEYLTMVAETSIGVILIKRILERLNQKDKIGRREFVGLGLKTGLATWLGFTGAPFVLRQISHHKQIGEDLTARLQNVSHKLHPEIMPFLLITRNVVIAEKEEWIQRELGKNGDKRQRLVSVLGASHSGIETMIKESSEERLKFLRSIKPILKQIFDAKTFYSIGRFDYDGKKWHASNLTEVPSLKEIVT